MLPLEYPDRIQVSFDAHRLVANAGLLLPVTLAQHLGLRELVDNHVDLGAAPGRVNTGDKIVTLVASAMAGGDCIDDADASRTGRTARVLGCVIKAPSTPRFREGRLWGRSCAASGGATSVRFNQPKVRSTTYLLDNTWKVGCWVGRRTDSRLQPAVAWGHPNSLLR